jgi:DNA-binding response OmpR family regulator
MSLRILFVEKDVTIVDLLVPSLERKGYQVTVARSHRQARSRLRSLRPDVLVVDVLSFGASGGRVGDSLRASLDGVPAILLQAEERPPAGCPAELIVTPPFTSRKLLHRVGKVAASVAGQESREIQAGPLALEPDTRMLRKGNETQRLRPKEAALLAMFMRNRGKVLNRPEIMKQVWETEYVGDTRTVNVHVRWLREKIEDDPNHPRFLRTVRGVGYRFEVPDEAADG